MFGTCSEFKWQHCKALGHMRNLGICLIGIKNILETLSRTNLHQLQQWDTFKWIHAIIVPDCYKALAITGKYKIKLLLGVQFPEVLIDQHLFQHFDICTFLHKNEKQISFILHTHTPVNAQWGFIGWLTISFNLNYQSRAGRERRFSFMLEIQLLFLQDLAISDQKWLWLTKEKLVQWWNDVCHRFNHLLKI